jgi:type III secretion system YscQ/HrcQ family protein
LNSLSATESDLAEPQEQSSVWHWRVEHQGRISAGLVAFDDMALESLAAQPIWHEAKLPTDPVILATPIHLQILLPTLPINTTELMQFAKGDIFIGGLIANLKACTLRHSVSGRSIYSGTLDLKGQILTISQGWLTQSSIRKYPMSDASTTTKSLSSIEDIPVEIAFGLGAITMTLEAFNNLQPGHSFSLNSSIVNDNVTILANGHEIGRGSLIVIGEHLGVELTDVGYNGIQ